MLFELIKQKSNFFFPPSSSRNVALFPLLPSWWCSFSLSLSFLKQANSVFLGALPYQGQLITLYKSGPKIRKPGRLRGGEIPVRKTERITLNYFKSHRKVLLKPSCILLKTIASHKPAKNRPLFLQIIWFFPAREIMIKIAAST